MHTPNDTVIIIKVLWRESLIVCGHVAGLYKWYSVQLLGCKARVTSELCLVCDASRRRSWMSFLPSHLASHYHFYISVYVSTTFLPISNLYRLSIFSVTPLLVSYQIRKTSPLCWFILKSLFQFQVRLAHIVQSFFFFHFHVVLSMDRKKRKHGQRVKGWRVRVIFNAWSRLKGAVINFNQPWLSTGIPYLHFATA